jgi:pyruvate dehydrogenase phosphatase
LGDGLWKWPKEVLEECHEGFWLRKLLNGYKTPPYMTAEPVVMTTEVFVSGKQPSFMIMASDGLWDHVSSEQAVRLVELWMDAKKRGTIGLQVSKKEKMETQLAWRCNHRRKVEEEDFAVLDENCATHLARNALGGGDEEVLFGVVGGQPPVSRYMRDDITVQVVFFGGRA